MLQAEKPDGPLLALGWWGDACSAANTILIFVVPLLTFPAWLVIMTEQGNGRERRNKKHLVLVPGWLGVGGGSRGVGGGWRLGGGYEPAVDVCSCCELLFAYRSLNCNSNGMEQLGVVLATTIKQKI